MNKKGIRFGVKVGGIFPNAGTLTRNPISDEHAKIVIDGINKIKEELIRAGNSEIANKLFAEYR